MRVVQSRLFKNRIKKFSKSQKSELDNVIRLLLKHPYSGNQKKGDLKGVFVYKFKIKNSLFLIAYRFSESLLELIMIGEHENYYRTLKSYIKNI